MIEPAIRCRRCKSRMDLVATIQPMGNEPGLNAYACTTCGHTDSELIALYKPARLAL
jgi:DNA-directed RNA polymerase subunit RPC12/RpoP